jgi:hypothetical protein
MKQASWTISFSVRGKNWRAYATLPGADQTESANVTMLDYRGAAVKHPADRTARPAAHRGQNRLHRGVCRPPQDRVALSSLA